MITNLSGRFDKNHKKIRGMAGKSGNFGKSIKNLKEYFFEIFFIKRLLHFILRKNPANRLIAGFLFYFLRFVCFPKFAGRHIHKFLERAVEMT